MSSHARPGLALDERQHEYREIQPTDWDRLACVYVRQSTPVQVIENRESTERRRVSASAGPWFQQSPDACLWPLALLTTPPMSS